LAIKTIRKAMESKEINKVLSKLKGESRLIYLNIKPGIIPLNALASVKPGKNAPPGLIIKLIISAAAPTRNPLRGPSIMPDSIIGIEAKLILSAGKPPKGTYISNITLRTKLIDINNPALTIVRDVNFRVTVLPLIFSSC
jgi:hypothetical protein